MGAMGVMTALSGCAAGTVKGQSWTGEMPDSITAAAKGLRDRRWSVTDLTTAYLAHAKALQPKLNAFITLSEEGALASAAELDGELGRGRVRGPLHGIPVVYKDNFDTAGVLTTMGSEFYSKRIAQSDAEAVRRLKAAGTVTLGKTNMNEFAAGVAGRNKFYGDVVNPWDASRWPGGSSSGTGAAIAAGLSLGGLGTDTGVSVRGPASWLGLVGVRPSYGRVSVRGTFPRAYSFDTVGPLAHTVEDAAILLTAIAGYDPSDRYAKPSAAEDFTADLNAGVQGLRLGVVEDISRSGRCSGSRPPTRGHRISRATTGDLRQGEAVIASREVRADGDDEHRISLADRLLRGREPGRRTRAQIHRGVRDRGEVLERDTGGDGHRPVAGAARGDVPGIAQGDR
jgi:Asp-tRNA(Asn)/Glu-tRNA(Gln) amidotransferase A subunit family amidase